MKPDKWTQQLHDKLADIETAMDRIETFIASLRKG